MNTSKCSLPFAAALIAFAVGFFLLPPAHAAVLVDWTFTSGSPQNPSNVAANVTAGLASWGPGYTIVSGVTGYGGSTNTAFSRADAAPNDFTTAFDDEQYLTVTLTAEDGYVLNLDSFGFDVGGSNNSSGGGPAFTASAQIRTSVDNFGASLTLTPGPTTVAAQDLAANQTLTLASYSANLAASGFQNLETIEIRIYGYANTNSTSSYLRFDNLSFEGTVIPEPSSALLLMSGCALFFMLLRRKTRLL